MAQEPILTMHIWVNNDLVFYAKDTENIIENLLVDVEESLHKYEEDFILTRKYSSQFFEIFSTGTPENKIYKQTVYKSTSKEIIIKIKFVEEEDSLPNEL